jgi:hypothetical protein
VPDNPNPNGPADSSPKDGDPNEGTGNAPENGPEGTDGNEGKPKDGDTDLGDAGKKALSEERAARKAAEKELAEIKAESNRLRRTNAATKGTDLEAIRDEIRAEFNAERLKDKVALAAAGRLADSSDAARFLDLESLSADKPEAIKAALDKLLTDRPYLAAKDGEKGWGDVGGAQRKAVEPEPKSPLDRLRRSYGSN